MDGCQGAAGSGWLTRSVWCNTLLAAPARDAPGWGGLLACPRWQSLTASQQEPKCLCPWQGLYGSFLYSTKPTFAPFFGWLRCGAEAPTRQWSCRPVWGWGRRALSPDVLRCKSPLDPILSFMVRVCSGKDLWPSALGSGLLPALYLSPPLAS